MGAGWNLLRSVARGVGYIIRTLLSFALCGLGLAIVWYGTPALWNLIVSVAVSSFEFLFTMQDPQVTFQHTFVIAVGWIGLLIAVWLKPETKLTYNLLMLAVFPLCYLFMKILVLYVIPNQEAIISAAHLSDFPKDLLDLSAWLKLFTNKELLLLSIQNFAISDLSVGTLILIHYTSFYTWWDSPIIGKLFITFILLVSFMLCPLGLTLYITSMLFLRKQFVIILAVAAVAGGLYYLNENIYQLGEPQEMFSHLPIILVGWIGLIFGVFGWPSLSKGISILAAVIPGFYYLNIFFRYQLKLDPPDFFSIDGWVALAGDPLVLVAIFAHLAIVNLGCATLTIDYFHNKYSSAQIVGKFFLIFFLGLEFVTPFGLFFFLVADWFVLPHLLKEKETPDDGGGILDSRPVHFGENLPEFPRNVFYFLKAVVAVVLLVLHLFMYILFVILCYLVSWFHLPKPLGSPQTHPTFYLFSEPMFLVPAFVRDLSGEMRVWLFSKRDQLPGFLFQIPFHILQFAAIVEIGVNANNPSPLSAALGRTFGDVFPFGDGIGIGDPVKLKEYLADPHNRKGPRSLVGRVSKTQAIFCYISTITLGLAPEEEGEKVIKARKVLHSWLRHFDFNLLQNDKCDPEFHALMARFPKLRDGKIPPDQQIFEVFGEVLYWMATPSPLDGDTVGHSQMKRSEKEAFLELVNNLFQFFPPWFNFLVLGGYMERKVNVALYKMRDAFFRDQGSAYNAAMETARAEGIAESEALRLIVSVFAIAGAAVPAKLAVAILKRIAADPVVMAEKYRQNKPLFIKECARLDPAVFWVNLLSHKEEKIGDRTIPTGTPVHLYIPFGNLDPRMYGPDPLGFDPQEDRIRTILTWNGMESSWWDGANGEKEYPRRCPGHNASIRALELIVTHYVDQLVPLEEGVQYQRGNASDVSGKLDSVTNSVVRVTSLRVENWSKSGYDCMDHFEAKERSLRMKKFGCFTLPTYDEDFINRLSPFYDFLGQCATLLPVSDSIWCAPNRSGRAWRKKTLINFPSVHVHYNEKEEDMNSDRVIKRLAFFGIGCHLTRKSEKGGFENDTTLLGGFGVRRGFLRYGAKVFFNQDRMPVRIFVSEFGKDFVPEDKEGWEMAKWIWKVSVFTLATLDSHLFECHLKKAHALAKWGRLSLSKDHPLRIILKPFMFHTIYINQLAGRTLICHNGLADRVWAFQDLDHILQTLNDGYSLKPNSFAEDLGLSRADFPLFQDQSDLRGIIRVYMEETVQLVEKKRDLKEMQEFEQNLRKELNVQVDCTFADLLTELVFNGTGVHEQVGNISDYQILPNLTGAKVAESFTTEPTQSYALNTALTTSTGIQQPALLDNWLYLFDFLEEEGVREKAKVQYKKFKAALKRFSENVVDQNKESEFPYPNMDPRFMDCSVSK